MRVCACKECHCAYEPEKGQTVCHWCRVGWHKGGLKT